MKFLKKLFYGSILANLVLTCLCYVLMDKVQKQTSNLNMIEEKMDALYFDSRQRDTILLQLLIKANEELDPSFGKDPTGKIAFDEKNIGR
tara:strand:- start:2228 stop:2497 length:270 start_codon:yes stop_codon:yes gene_type:complete